MRIYIYISKQNEKLPDIKPVSYYDKICKNMVLCLDNINLIKYIIYYAIEYNIFHNQYSKQDENPMRIPHRAVYNPLL